MHVMTNTSSPENTAVHTVPFPASATDFIFASLLTKLSIFFRISLPSASVSGISAFRNFCFCKMNKC